jgi:predicted GNAT family acetyltransferase
LKRYTQANCKYTFAKLEKTVIEAMDSMELKTIQRCAMCSKRLIIVYMNSVTPEQRAFVEKKYQSHQRETWKIVV